MNKRGDPQAAAACIPDRFIDQDSPEKMYEAAGLDAMVGNMMGTSLAMAPAFLVGQLCKVVDLDGPIFLTKDRPRGAEYSGGLISIPTAFWG